MKILKIFKNLLEGYKDTNSEDSNVNVESEISTIIKKYSQLGLIAWINVKEDYGVEIASIKIPDKAKRKTGLGSAIMVEITSLCDKYNLLCGLTPVSTETPKNVLLTFYKKFGFVSNMGSKKDFRFRNTMIRYPR